MGLEATVSGDFAHRRAEHPLVVPILKVYHNFSGVLLLVGRFVNHLKRRYLFALSFRLFISFHLTKLAPMLYTKYSAPYSAKELVLFGLTSSISEIAFRKQMNGMAQIGISDISGTRTSFSGLDHTSLIFTSSYDHLMDRGLIMR
jgi:hypothetical protein